MSNLHFSLPKIKQFNIPKLTLDLKILRALKLFLLALMIVILGFGIQKFADNQNQLSLANNKIADISKQFSDLESQDQFLKNKNLSEEIKNIEDTYSKAVKVYQDLVDLREISKSTDKLDQMFANSLSQLSKHEFASASTQLTDLDLQIEKAKQESTAASAALPENTPVNNTPPGSGYSRQSVQADAGTFTVSLIAADLSNTKIIVDTASDSDCGDNCPVLPLSTYVSRNGAFAGINGSYFCPVTYPDCSGKTNTFDLLVMNKNKHYFNSDNNVYSNNPGVIFGSGYIRFVSAVSQWGRDTSIDSMLSNYPLLVNGGNISFGGDDDPKKGSKGNRSFVANKGNIVYIGVVHSATVAESARVLKAMGMENALNLDDGGSTALWSGGYKVGPGRDLPNVILFVRK